MSARTADIGIEVGPYPIFRHFKQDEFRGIASGQSSDIGFIVIDPVGRIFDMGFWPGRPDVAVIGQEFYDEVIVGLQAIELHNARRAAAERYGFAPDEAEALVLKLMTPEFAAGVVNQIEQSRMFGINAKDAA